MSTSIGALLFTAGAGLLIASGSTFADDQSQLAASARLDPSEIGELTLTEVAAHKFSHDSIGQKAGIEPGSYGSRESLAASAGLTPDEAAGMTLTEIAAYHFNHGSSDGNQQTVGGGWRVTMASRSVGASQLAHSAGLTEAEAQGMSLRQIAAYFFNNGSADSKRTDLP